MGYNKSMKDWNVNYKLNAVPEIAGTDYAIGQEFGKIFKKFYKKATKKLKKQRKNARVMQFVEKIKKNIHKNFRPVYDEICGRADGAEVDFDLLLLHFCRNEILTNPIVEKCTSIMVNTPENVVFAHNEDDFYTPDNARIVKILREGGPSFYAIAAEDTLCSGSIFVGQSMIFSVNYIHLDHKNLDFLPAFFLCKMLSTCQNAQQAMHLLETVPVAAAIGVNLCDVSTGQMWCVEKVWDDVDIKPVQGVNLHTNHLLAKKFDAMPQIFHSPSTSLSRYHIARQLIGEKTTLSADEAAQVLGFYKSCDFDSVLQKMNTGHKSLTLATLVVDLKNKKSTLKVHNRQHTTFALDLPFATKTENSGAIKNDKVAEKLENKTSTKHEKGAVKSENKKLN